MKQCCDCKLWTRTNRKDCLWCRSGKKRRAEIERRKRTWSPIVGEMLEYLEGRAKQ